MVKVRIWGSLASATDDRTEVEVEASTLRDLLDGLGAAYPALRPQLARGRETDPGTPTGPRGTPRLCRCG